jgi:PAS domain S-box-containing protein
MSVEQLLAVEYLTQLLNFAPLGVIRVDERGRVLAWNVKACEMLGGADEDLPNVSIFELLPGEDRLRRLITGSLSGSSDSPVEVFEIQGDDRTQYVELRSAALPSDSTPDAAMLLMQDVTDRIETEKEREETLRQIAFLADASGVLASSLELGVVLERLAEAVVPFLGDWCAVDLVDREGAIRRIVVRHHDPAKAAYGDKLKAYSPGRTSENPVIEMLQSNRPQMFKNGNGDLLSKIADNEEHRALLAELGIEAGLVVPMSSGGRLLGSLMLVSSDPKRVYGASELGLAQDIAQRAALAMENARLFQERSYVARTFQESLLPPSLPHIPGADVAARYRAAGEGNEVGGDFYDLFALRDESWGLVMGDVCGKGPDAATITALARYTTRAAAMQVSNPREVLEGLNEAILEQTSDERFATVAYACVEPSIPGSSSRRIVVACAGHPFPLVLRQDGSVEEVGQEGTVLGLIPNIDVNDKTVDLKPGEVMVLYTDGVTEARGADGKLFGGWKLRNLLSQCWGLSADEVAGRIEQTILEYQNGDPRDDIAILALRIAE